MREGQTQRRNVFVAMDGSKHAMHAFDWYVENVYRDTDNVIMAYCAEMGVNLPPMAQLGNPSTVQAIIKSHEEEVQHVLKAINDLANKYNMKHTVVRLQPHTGESIVKAAKEENVEFIIAGSRGLGTIRRTIMGSVSDYILHHSAVPVFICKHADEHH